MKVRVEMEGKLCEGSVVVRKIVEVKELNELKMDEKNKLLRVLFDEINEEYRREGIEGYEKNRYSSVKNEEEELIDMMDGE